MHTKKNNGCHHSLEHLERLYKQSGQTGNQHPQNGDDIRKHRPSLRSSLLLGLGAATLFMVATVLTNIIAPALGLNISPQFSELNRQAYPWAFGLDPHSPESAAIIHNRLQQGTINVDKSTITGIVDSETMTASLYWTMVLKNKNNTDKEAAITMDLPTNSALSRATLWINGVAQEAAFSANDKVEAAYDYIVVRHRDPMLIKQVAPNRIKILASPVTANGGEMKLRIGITTPIQSNDNGRHFLRLPKIVSSNLAFDSKQDVHLSSNTTLSGLGVTDESGIFLLRANIPVRDLEFAQVFVEKPSINRFATRLTHTNPMQYVEATIVDSKLQLKRTTNKPDCTYIDDEDAAFRLSNLWAHHEIERRASHGDNSGACELANIYRIVSSVSGATVLEEDFDYDMHNLNRNMNRTMASSTAQAPSIDAFNNQAPMLQGATNGTIGSQGGNSSIIAGVNTSGTVRVNNLVQLEALLNLGSNLLQFMGIAFAITFGVEAWKRGGLKFLGLSRRQGLVLASAIGTLGILSPSICNWIMAALRDSNLLT